MTEIFLKCISVGIDSGISFAEKMSWSRELDQGRSVLKL